jgi:predicted ester cyclase
MEDEPMSRYDTAMAFFDACETGKGWGGCRGYCTADATFSCQADALKDTATLADYADWMQGLLTPIPDGHYKLTAFAIDEDCGTVIAAAQFHGTQTGEGGPVPPTGKSVVSDYAYVMELDGDKISHMTKIWNDVHALRGLGWA